MYWIIEPHADDAFLSLHKHIKDWKKEGKSITIVTVFSDAKRESEAALYAGQVGVGYRCLRFKGGMNGLQGKTELPDFSCWGIILKPTDKIVFPLGLQHPDHKAVRAQAPKGAWLYVEIPYQAKQKLSGNLLCLLQGKTIVSIRYASKRKWRYVEVFKSQSKFYFYNSPETMYCIPEIIVKAII